MAMKTDRRGNVMESDNSTRHSASDFSSYPDEALGLPYYHPTISTMREVLDLLFEYLSSSGFFLLRKSFTKSSTLTVSVVFSQSVKHFTISQKETGSYFLQDKLFASIQDLVSFYGRQEVPNKEGFSGVYLKHPVPDLRRHHFFVSNSKRLASSELKHNSRSSAEVAPRISPDSPLLSGYLQLNLTQESKPRPSASGSRPMSLRDGTGCRVGRRSSRLESVLSGELPTRSSSHPRSLQDRPHPQQQIDDEAFAKSSSRRQTSIERDVCYCYARSPYTQLTTSLVERLNQRDDAAKCRCGIYHGDAELPRGWSFHRSTESETYGRVLFTGPDGQSDWNLPLEVSLELSADQQDKIRNLICLPPPRPCSPDFDAITGESGAATTEDNNSGYLALLS